MGIGLAAYWEAKKPPMVRLRRQDGLTTVASVLDSLCATLNGAGAVGERLDDLKAWTDGIERVVRAPGTGLLPRTAGHAIRLDAIDSALGVLRERLDALEPKAATFVGVAEPHDEAVS